MARELTLDFDYTALPEKEKPSKIKQYIHKFYYSYFYLFTCAILAAIAWKTAIPEIAFVPMMVLFAVMFLVLDDITPFIPGFFMLTMIFGPEATPDNMIYLLGYAVIAIIPAIYHLIKYKPNKTLGKFFKPQLVISIVLIMGGLGSTITPGQYVAGLPQGIALGVGALGFYLLFSNYSKPNGYDFNKYFAESMTALGLCLVLIQIMVMFFGEVPFMEMEHFQVTMGAMQSNNMATFYLLTMPFAFYLVLKMPKYSLLHMMAGIIQFLACVFTYGVGGILFGTIEIILCIIYTIYKSGEYRWLIVTNWIIIAGMLLILYACTAEMMNNRVKYMLSRFGFDTGVTGAPEIDQQTGNVIENNDVSRGRLDLYKEGWSVFKMFPLFGAGLGYTSPNQVPSVIQFFMFHSTFFQVIACLGLVGLLGYIYFYYKKIRFVFTGIKSNPFQAIVLFAFIGFEGYSMVDCGTFIPMPFAFMTIFMMMAIEIGKKQIDDKKLKEEFEIKQLA